MSDIAAIFWSATCLFILAVLCALVLGQCSKIEDRKNIRTCVKAGAPLEACYREITGEK